MREALAIVIDTSIPGARVVRTLDRLVEWRGKPDAIRVDNGPEYLSQVLTAWCQAQGVRLHDIQPGKPNQNASIERFNRTFRHEVLDAYVFESLREVGKLLASGSPYTTRNAPMTAWETYPRPCSDGRPKKPETLL